jgi:hypothetical protein
VVLVVAAADGGGALSGLAGEGATGFDAGGRSPLVRGWLAADARPPRSSATAPPDPVSGCRFLLADAEFVTVVESLGPMSARAGVAMPQAGSA